MNILNNYLIPKASNLTGSLLNSRFLAQQNWTSVQDMKEGVGTIAGIVTLVAWLLALIAWFVGAAQKDNNPAMSKYCFYVVWMFAIGGPVVSLIFYIFVGASGTPTPKF